MPRKKKASKEPVPEPVAEAPVVEESSDDTACPGFIMEPAMRKIRCSAIKADGNVFRSRKCTGRMRETAVLCNYCSEGKEAALNVLKRKQAKKEICNGIVDEKLRELAISFGWDKEKSEMSCLEFYPDCMRAKTCDGVKSANQLTCDACRKAKNCIKSMDRKKKNRPPASKEKHLLCTGEKYLTEAEKSEKALLIQNRMRQLGVNLRREQRRTAKLTRDLERYKPKDRMLQRAIRSVKETLERDHAKLKTPRCYWMTGDVVCDGVGSTSITEIKQHVFDKHLMAMHDQNQQLEANNRRYVCCWKDCGRNRPFDSWKLLTKHMMTNHIGTPEQLEAFEATLCSAINSNRAPTARRYNQSMINYCSKLFYTPMQWHYTRNASGAPLPSRRTINKLRNIGPEDEYVEGDDNLQPISDSDSDTEGELPEEYEEEMDDLRGLTDDDMDDSLDEVDSPAEHTNEILDDLRGLTDESDDQSQELDDLDGLTDYTDDHMDYDEEPSISDVASQETQ